VTQLGTLIGTPEYLAPEVRAGREADARSDLYALGVVLYEALAGRPSFRSPTPAATMYAHLTAEPILLSQVRRDAPAWLVAIVHRSVTLTLDTYSHVLPDAQAQAAATIDALLGGGARANC